MHFKRRILASLSALALIGVLGIGINNTFQRPNHFVTAATESINNSTPSQQLADSVVNPVKGQINGDLKWNGHGAYTIGNGDNGSSTLNANVNHAPYASNAQPDNLHRATFGEALLNKTTRQYANRNQTGNSANNWKPVGWNQMSLSNGGYNHLYDRGHLLGYALVGGIQGFDASEHNPANIVTQTAWANEADSPDATGQNYYESIVRQALDQNKTVVYRVKALYNQNELVPRATWIQAKSTDGSININVVVPNAQNGVNINYENGQGQLGNTGDAAAANSNPTNQDNNSSDNASSSNASSQNGPVDNQNGGNGDNGQSDQTLPATGYQNWFQRTAHKILTHFEF